MSKLRFHLFHGRENPDQDMDDYGFDGPTLHGVKALRGVYGITRVVFVSEEAAAAAIMDTGWKYFGDHRTLEIPTHDDMIRAGGAYYGDWELAGIS